MRRVPPIYPLFLALLPVSSLLAALPVNLHPRKAIRASLVGLAATLLGMLLVRVIVKDWDKAAIITAVGLLPFIGFGSVLALLVHFFGTGSLPILKIAMLLSVVMVFSAAVYGTSRVRRPLGGATAVLNVMAVASLATPICRVVRHEYELSRPWPAESLGSLPKGSLDTSLLSQTSRPDIYYIVLDGYAREDILQDIFGYDNRDLRDFLKDRGFFVVEKSRSNYGQTALSVASSLNMAYLDGLVEVIGAESSDRKPLLRLIHWSRVRSFLEGRGYQTQRISSSDMTAR